MVEVVRTSKSWRAVKSDIQRRNCSPIMRSFITLLPTTIWAERIKASPSKVVIGSWKRMKLPHLSWFVKRGRFYLTIFLGGVLLVFLRHILFPSPIASSIERDILNEPWRRSPLWVEDQKPQINPHKFQYLKNRPNYCNSKQIDLLILVASATDHFEEREAIRATWGAPGVLEKFRTKVLFLLGQGKEQQSLIDQESNLCQDIIQEDFQDTYSNLTLKTVMGLKWTAIFCPQAKYVMKTDDDIFVNVPLLHRALAVQQVDQIIGCIKNSPIHGFQPLPASEGLPFLPPAHPAFTAGAGYILPGSLIQELYIASLNTRFLPIEDVFTTGHCAKRIGAHPPLHDGRFSCGEMVTQECQMKNKFTGHKVSPEMQFSIIEALEAGQC